MVKKRLTTFVVTKERIPEYDNNTGNNIFLMKKNIDKNFNYNLSKMTFKENNMKKLVIMKNVGNVAIGMLKYDKLGP